MHLWTDFEGKVVNGDYTLGKLLRSEGRNGFFSAADSKGQQAVMRLTEAHFDEEEQLGRWQKVATLKQEHLIGIERTGKTAFDGVSLTYALMESDDANLEDVLKERPLTAAEGLQVARAVTEALRALHGSGMVHEHIEPANVYAVGEVVKLRSDCVRECVADQEFLTAEGCAEKRRKDVHDLGKLLLRCMTLESEWHPLVRLPEPLYRVVPGAIEGTLTLDQIDTMLGREEAPKPVAAAPTEATAKPPVTTPPVAAAPVQTPVAAAAVAEEKPQEQARNFRPRNDLSSRRNAEAKQDQSKRLLMIAGCAVVFLLAIIAVWRMVSSKPKPEAEAAAPVAAAPVVAQRAAPQPMAAPVAPKVVAHGWHVVAFTYNHAGQAQAKADSLAAKHAGLSPQVFSPSGHAPYYVALGGVMSEPEAKALLQRARRSGMPRDTFMRNF
ncbi:hypothetical protein ACFQBQ_13600 [Granulicella cerasi]|uniref:SPOR domain-containing protein n=1 Tax=Granulicella cerasi TaxID=741063 RepID=A0ABW1ZAT8_9BACT|nr:hypothetical protein [Granulicella cerasi]